MKGASLIAPFGLRMPEDLKEKVSERAKSNGRSMNAEIVQIIEDAIDAIPSIGVVEKSDLVHRYRELAKEASSVDELPENWFQRYDKLTIDIFDTISPLLLLRGELVKMYDKVQHLKKST